MISIVACCHGAKLCAYAARDFRSQHKLVSGFPRLNTFNKPFKSTPPSCDLILLLLSVREAGVVVVCEVKSISKPPGLVRVSDDFVHEGRSYLSRFTSTILVPLHFIAEMRRPKALASNNNKLLKDMNLKGSF